MSQPLYVNPDHLTNLASNQDTAAAKIQSAAAKPKGIAGSLLWDHGEICLSTRQSMRNLMQARNDACDFMQQTSQDLSAKLTAATDAYGNTDQQNADNLNKQMQSQ